MTLTVVALPATPTTAECLYVQLRAWRDGAATVLPVGSGPEAVPGTPDLLLYEWPATAGPAALTALQARLDARTRLVVLCNAAPPALAQAERVQAVLPAPPPAAALRGQLARLRAERRQSGGRRHATVVGFCNAFGSSGGTLLAVNTATALASRHGARTVLIDLDLQFGKAAHLLGLKPRGHVLEALREAERLEAGRLQALLCAHDSGLQVLAAPPSLMPHEAGTAAVRRLLAVAAAEFDVVVLDLPRLVSEWTLEAMAACDRVLLLTQNTLGAMRDTRRLLDYLVGSGELAEERIEVVNSRAFSRLASTSIGQMKRVLGRERIHRIRNDYAAALAAADQGLPLHRAAPHSALTQDCDRLAQHLWRLHRPDLPAPAARPVRWFERLRGLPAATPLG